MTLTLKGDSQIGDTDLGIIRWVLKPWDLMKYLSSEGRQGM